MYNSTVTRYAKDKKLKIVEAKKHLQLEVLPSDIKKARRNDPQSCGFAKACKREDPGVKKAFFFKSSAYIEYPDKIVRYKVPSSMQHEIVSFDRAKKMEPGKYRLSPIATTQKLDYMRKKARVTALTRKATKKPRPGAHTLRHQTTNVRGLTLETAKPSLMEAAAPPHARTRAKRGKARQ